MRFTMKTQFLSRFHTRTCSSYLSPNCIRVWSCSIRWKDWGKAFNWNNWRESRKYLMRSVGVSTEIQTKNLINMSQRRSCSWLTQPPVQLEPGAIYLGVQLFGLQSNISSPCSSEVNLQSPIHLRGIVLNYLGTRLTSLFNILILVFGLLIILFYFIKT
jgi:hypothetical protein